VCELSARRKTTCESGLTTRAPAFQTRTLRRRQPAGVVDDASPASVPRQTLVYNRIPSRPTFLRKARPRFSLLDVASTRHFSSRPRVRCGVMPRASVTNVAETSNVVLSAKFYTTLFPPDCPAGQREWRRHFFHETPHARCSKHTRDEFLGGNFFLVASTKGGRWLERIEKYDPPCLSSCEMKAGTWKIDKCYP